MIFELTAEDIANAKASPIGSYNAICCPMAQMFNRYAPPGMRVFVGRDHAHMVLGEGVGGEPICDLKLPRSMAKAIRAYDEGKKITPRKFRVAM